MDEPSSCESIQRSRNEIEHPEPNAQRLGLVAVSYVEVLGPVALSAGFMTALFRATAGLCGADEHKVEWAGHCGFVVGVLLAIAVLFVDAI
ncbi:MAG: hypothetical protein QOF13_1522 [Solirubrobacterales bacterium]|nr:hypothetical protein [Solirubrobacterales bacterium]